MKKIVFLFFFPIQLLAQNYTSYFTGNSTDIITQPAGGVCLMGGATEDDNAMIWFLEQANGGDVLVLRASGSDGYNDYFYTDLGVTVNSVETIVFNNALAANETYVQDKIEKAEAIWFAGGDQWNYISYWKNSPIDSLINIAVNQRKIVIGGTSAGMAILGGVYFTAENGTITSATALNNPYATTATIDSADFLNVPYLSSVITDTHYDNPDRRARHTVFMAKMLVDYEMMPYGIACEEYVAVCVDTFGIARVYGGYPTYDEQAYFLQVNCKKTSNPTPENCVPSEPLNWSLNESALMVYKVNATSTGANYFDLNDWKTGNGGQWQYWWVDNGTFNTVNVDDHYCYLDEDEMPLKSAAISVYPNPSDFLITIVSENETPIEFITITDLSGRVIFEIENNSNYVQIETAPFAAGIYLLNCYVDNNWESLKLIVK